MSTTAAQQVDLTAPSDSLTYVEVLTPAGIVRVNTNLVDTRTRRPVVVVEVEPNTTYQPKTAAEDWHVSWADRISRFDVTLTKRDPEAFPVSSEEKDR